MELSHAWVVHLGMRMHWVEEDCQALALSIAAGNRWAQDKAALSAGRLIRRLRRGLQVSQLQLAERAGVARSMLARMESGGDVQLSSLRRLLAALGCGLVLLPASEERLVEFRKRARWKRGSERAWQRLRNELGMGRDADDSPRFRASKPGEPAAPHAAPPVGKGQAGSLPPLHPGTSSQKVGQ